MKQSERQNGYGTVNYKLPPYISEQLVKFLQYVRTYTTHSIISPSLIPNNNRKKHQHDDDDDHHRQHRQPLKNIFMKFYYSTIFMP